MPAVFFAVMTGPIDYTKFPATELRLPRATFSATLQKICESLEKNASRSISVPISHRRRKETAHLQACNLWVVGSYARGALACADLDIVLEYAQSGYLPERGTIVRAFFGPCAGVRVHHGTPRENSLGVVFSEAVQVWAPGMDWRAALAALPENPGAGRFARASDVIPLRADQLGATVEQMREVAQMHNDGVLQWSFTPLTEIEPVYTSTQEDERRFLARFGHSSAMKRKLAPLVLGFARKVAAQREVQGEILFRPAERDIQLGHIRILAENLRLDVAALDDLAVSCLVLLPSLSARVPNGFWTLERGPNHPVRRLFADTRAWVLARRDGAPAVFRLPCADGVVVGAEFFRKPATAQDVASVLNEDARDAGLGAEDDYVVTAVLGEELLKLLVRLDVVMTEAGEIALNWRGQLYCGANSPASRLPTTQEVAAYFASESLSYAHRGVDAEGVKREALEANPAQREALAA